ncbi:hypothetical protein BDV95DRAFT_671776 [Massariosphaeria phaeospora]|uniref:Transcription factor domain-containing protein n=1 Tax=Massariosphaeria phaeospora TaxID=100035 RepID=A0A7C8HZP0_9PLEO|nr:hypothetical protein BDV95DRAFT_671776 [Massariosphaeria phaeospora]
MTTSNSLLSSKPVGSTVPGDETPTLARSSATPHESTSFTLLPSNHHHHHHCPNSVRQSSAIETDFIMKYLDFVFPSLFPFYRPSLFETGRSWLLVTLGKSKIAYHSAVSLTCYYSTMALTDIESDGEHTDYTPATKLERTETLESVIQVLIFEIALGKSAPWNLHLSPAFALFENVMASSNADQGQGQSRLASVLLNIGQPLWTKPGQASHVWSPDQAGFRFCASLLIFIDVVASTTIQEPPRLMNYHSDVLARKDDGVYVVNDAEI